MLLAISTTLGIHDESDENASGSSRAWANDGASAALRPAAATEPQVQAALLLGQDAEGQVQPGDEVEQRVAEEPGPGLADVAELAGQRRRRPARRGPQQLDERAAVRADRRTGRRRRPRGR